MKGIPEDILQGSSTRIVPIVSCARTVNIIFDYWDRNYEIRPAAVVVEGPLAGGHLGFKKNQIDDPDFALENIIPEVLEAVKKYEQKWDVTIPVIAAGGIYTGEDVLKFLKLGAAGVQMATRFVTTHECDASDEFKMAYINSKPEDIVIIDSPVGLPGRAIKNDFIDKVSNGIKKPFNCPWKCLRTCDITNSPYCIAIALHNARSGHLADGFAFAGANAHLADKIISVKEMFDDLKEEYRLAQEK
jgi:NAD(P)H-dependent flavin oxidoreductase YrpB (nitropropane dioxygenase family)